MLRVVLLLYKGKKLSFTEKNTIIPNENEINWILNDAVEKNEDDYDILYLVKNSKPDLESLKRRNSTFHRPG